MSPEHKFPPIPRRAPRVLIASLLGIGLGFGCGAPAHADDPPEKRAEGRYFVEAAGIMLGANDFDTVIADVDADGPGAGGSVEDVAEMSAWSLQQPKITVGLNRPGKTSVIFTVHDFELNDRRVPVSFQDAGDQVLSTPFLPPGIAFQRRRPTGGLVPNWGEDFGYIHRMDYQSLEFAVHRTAYENERFRLRWIAGLRYAELVQQTSLRVAFAEEGGAFGVDERDFFSFQVNTTTHGVGPHFGLAGRYMVGKNKKWIFSAQADVALIPESTNAFYALSLVDVGQGVQSPTIPGVDLNQLGFDTFNGFVVQTDFTEMTELFEGTIGVRYQITRGISVGVEGWHMRWMNLLSAAGVVETVHADATYVMIPPSTSGSDPQLRDTESIIRVPRFNRRDDASFDGMSLNLRFEF